MVPGMFEKSIILGYLEFSAKPSYGWPHSGNPVSRDLGDGNFNRPSPLTRGKEAKRLVVAQVPTGTQPLIPRFIKSKKIYSNR